MIYLLNLNNNIIPKDCKEITPLSSLVLENINYYEDQIKHEPNNNWKIEKNWYRIYGY